MRSLSLLILVASCLAASTAWARQPAEALAGTWVSAETLRGLEGGRAVEVGCHLVIGGEPLAIEERCAERRTEWGWLEVEERRGTIEVRDGLRRLVNRAGTPNELELRRGGELLRLYRVAPGEEETVAQWAMLPPQAGAEAEAAAAGDSMEVESGAAAAVQREPIVPRSRFSCASGGAGAAALGFVAAGGWLALRRRGESR